MDFKRWFVPVLACILAAFILLPSGSALSENLLYNADFMELNDEGLPADWYTDAYVLDPGYTVFSFSEGDTQHPRAVQIQNIGENDARFAQTVEVEPESIYLLSGFIRAENVTGGHGANLSVEGVYAFSEKVYDTDGQWQYIEYYGETGPDQYTLTVFARLGGYSGISTGKAWFADLSLTKADRIPGDGIADLWYRDVSDDYESEEDEESIQAPGAAWPWLILIGLLYVIAAAYLIYREQIRRPSLKERDRVRPVFVLSAMVASLVLRMVICCFVEGYMVDVSCFLSWGHTMASVGPASFYEATSFCDYPPLYTYVLALNSIVSGLFGGEGAVTRVVFRFVPCLCDILGCWMLYRILLMRKDVQERTCFAFLAAALLNPATILNSAAWGQMDSVLCLLLTAVALYAYKSKWKAAIPLYVVAVLVKPQALMLGPLGLAYMVLAWFRAPESRKQLLYGILLSLAVLAVCIIPFSLRQNWDWIIQLYGKTLASYPYATVNTANLWYLLGGNWSSVTGTAPLTASLVLSAACAGYGFWWYKRARELQCRFTETIISFVFAAVFVVFAAIRVSWAWNGGLAMAFAFAVILSPAVRSKDIRMLPWLGGLLYILLYVFGVKMHERYLFPALMLLAAAWAAMRDRRILYVAVLFSFTVFINEGIVLDNSIRLGSSLGHLNNDTVWLADIISIMNIGGAVYAVWLSAELFMPGSGRRVPEAHPPVQSERTYNRSLHWSRKDTILVLSVTSVFALISLLTLGSAKAPQTVWTSSSPEEQIVFDLGEYREDFEVLYFAQVSRKDFSFSASEDGETWEEETWAQMDQGQCWKWKYVTDSYYDESSDKRTYYNTDPDNIVRFSGRFLRLSARQLGLRLCGILIRDPEGNILPAEISGRTGAEPGSELYSDPAALIDEQDTMEALPALFGAGETADTKVQPSWWNSSYFDEIYHARTAWEFLQGSVPYETSHPPLGKVLMSAFVALFGMTPFGWRFAGALAGILMLPGMYLLGKQLTKKTTFAVLACMLMALDCMHLTQTQIATIDSFPVLFIIFAYFFMLRFLQTDFVREKLSTTLVSLGLSGVFMGLSIASKWIGIYAGAGLAVLFFWHCIRTVRNHQKERPAGPAERQNEEDRNDPPKLEQENGGTAYALRRTLVLCAWCILFFVFIPAAIYLMSYIPYMAYNAKRIHSLSDYISEVWRAQVGMFNYHSTPNLGMDHPFYSPWWQWPVIGKPMYYAAQQYLTADSHVHHSIFCFGNPVIWFGGLAALFTCLFKVSFSRRYSLAESPYFWHLRSADSDPRYMFLLTGLMAQYLPWVLVPRGTYIYHYFASLPFLMLFICLVFDLPWSSVRLKKAVLSVFLIAAAVFFILLFPYASGMNVSSGWLNIGRSLLRIWY